jgi:hypothetical protein
MGSESYEYRGERITVHVFEVKPSRWTWAYTIDSHRSMGSSDQPPTLRSNALVEARRAAEFLVDRMRDKRTRFST